MLALPSRSGWMVSWYTGKESTIKYKNGRQKTIRWKDNFTHQRKEVVEAKAEGLRKAGYEIEYITECIF